MDFFGRKQEIRDLMALWGKRTGSLVTCRGRRRIGKSTLIERFALLSEARFIRIEGVRPRAGYDDDQERQVFAAQLAAQTDDNGAVPKNWLEAFTRLNDAIDDNGRTVVLLDEVSWMAAYEPMFADLFKIVWDGSLSKHDRLILVLCGSVSAWIKEEFVDNGAFYGRRSLDLIIPELPLNECVKFWGEAASRIDLREIADVLSVTGGVPRYLREIDPGLSACENIKRLAFRPKSVLREDFDEMFSDVIIRQPTLTGRIVRTLVNGALSVSEIADALGMGKGGKISSALEQLSEAGLVAVDAGRNPETGTLVRERCYRLKDNYARFYLKYIEPVRPIIDSGAYRFVSLEGLDGWESLMGLQFENLIVNNYAALIPHLRLGNSLIESAAPYRRQRSSSPASGVQIDFLIQTRHNNYVIEIKRQREIGREVIDEVKARLAKIRQSRGRSNRPVLVYEGHLAPIVETEGYFDSLVSLRVLLGL